MPTFTRPGGRRSRPRWVPLVILALAAGAFYLTTTFDEVPAILKRGMQPADFPQLMIGLIAGLALWLLWRERSGEPPAVPRIVSITMAMLIIFPFLALVDLFGGLAIFSVALSFLWGERRPLALATVALLVPLMVFFLFDIVFEIRFPRGILTNLWYD
ncbi:MAG: tripartite tricarboxylate transporter TctB family protein [Pseudomonadota bacterium]